MGSSKTGLVYAIKRQVEIILDDEDGEPERPVSRAENEKWEAEGQVINPEVPEPSRSVVEKWRTFVSSVYSHPNLLVHPDVKCIREIFKMFGADILFESPNLMIELGLRSNQSPNHHLQSALAFVEVPSKLVFGHIQEIQLIPHLNVAIIRKYSVMENFKSALLDLFGFISTYPEVLLYPNYSYLYDFLITFGVTSEAITYEIYKTQLRRAKLQVPASTLLLKQEELEIIEINDMCTSEDENDTPGPSNDSTETEIDSMRSSRSKRIFRQGSNLSGGDSGFGSFDHHENSSNSSDIDVKLLKEEQSESNVEPNIGSKTIKLFKCTVCPREFKTKHACNCHIASKHPNATLIPLVKREKRTVIVTPFDCSACSKHFMTRKTCQNHIEKFHPNNRYAHPVENGVTPLSRKLKKKCSKKGKKSSNIKGAKQDSNKRKGFASADQKSKKSKQKCKKKKKKNGETKCNKSENRKPYTKKQLQKPDITFPAQVTNRHYIDYDDDELSVDSLFYRDTGFDEHIVSQNSF